MSSPAPTSRPVEEVRGKIIEAEIKPSVDATRPLPLTCALYAVESTDGVWLCAYYGSNRSVFDYLPQKGTEIKEKNLGITFHTKQFVPKEQYQPARWDDFKKSHMMAYGGHAE